MEQNHSWKSNSRSVFKISRHLCNPDVYYSIHKGPQLVRNLTQMNPIHTFPHYLSKIHSNIILQVRGLFNVLKRSGFYGEDLLAPRPNSIVRYHPLSVVHDCLFNIFKATQRMLILSPPSATWGQAMALWHGIYEPGYLLIGSSSDQTF